MPILRCRIHVRGRHAGALHLRPRDTQKTNKAVGKDGKYHCVVGTCSSRPFKFKRDLTKHYYKEEAHPIEDLLFGGVNVWNEIVRERLEPRPIINWLVDNGFIQKKPRPPIVNKDPKFGSEEIGLTDENDFKFGLNIICE